MNSYYNKNVIEDIDKLIVLNPFFEEWYKIVEEILLNDEFQKRKLFNHHHNLSVWDHSILVSFKAFVYSKYFDADSRICAIAGLLHDFYPDAWLYNEELVKLENGRYTNNLKVKKPLFRMHGFVHGQAAADNYVRYFPHLENKKITNTIKCHMFPLTPIPPRYKEGYIITMVDKLNSVRELPSLSSVPSMVKNGAVKFVENIKTNM